MASENAGIDGNTRNTATAVTDDSNAFIKKLRIDDTTKGLKVLVVGGTGSGTVNSVTDGSTTVSNPTQIDFTSGATVSDGGGGVVDVAINSSGIIIGTTTITSGTTTKVLYDNTGKVGEYTVSGSGSVAMTTSPVFTTPNIGSATGSVSGNAGTVTGATFTTALTVNTGTVTLTGNVANTSVLTIGAGAVSVSGSNTGDNAANSSTMYIGTTSVALNRASASLVLTGITSIDGTATNLSGTPALPNGTTATTQSANNNSTKLATTAYVDGKSSGVMTLLKAGSGTDTNTSATNVDTVAISGLTALDTIKIIYNYSMITQNGAAMQIYSNTDSQDIIKTAGNNTITVNNTRSGNITLQQAEQNNKIINVGDIPAPTATTGNNTMAFTGVSTAQSNTMTTAWTGSWTLALRNQGVTSGGTLQWTWKVYKIAGQ